MIRLVIADDHPLVRAGFRQLAASDAEIMVVGEAVDGTSLLECLRTVTADVVVLDISMPGPGFLELVGRLRQDYPGVAILVVTVHPEGHLAVEALRAGAAGYVTKTQSSTELVAAVRKVYEGGRYVSSSLAEHLAVELQTTLGELKRDVLSRRERQVLRLLADGRAHKEIAATCGMSPKTVSTYRSRILRKLKLRTTADLVRYVVQSGTS